MCGMCGEGEYLHGASLCTCGARSVGLLLQGGVYLTLSWPDSFSGKAVVISLLHTLAIFGQTFPSKF